MQKGEKKKKEDEDVGGPHNFGRLGTKIAARPGTSQGRPGAGAPMGAQLAELRSTIQKLCQSALPLGKCMGNLSPHGTETASIRVDVGTIGIEL